MAGGASRPDNGFAHVLLYLICESIEVGDWHSYLRLKGFSGSFNTVMFEQEARGDANYQSAVAGRLRRVTPADGGEFSGSKGTGDDCRALHVGPVLKGVLTALAVVAAVCLGAAFFKGYVGWRDVVAACVVPAAVVCTAQALLRLRGRG